MPASTAIRDATAALATLLKDGLAGYLAAGAPPLKAVVIATSEDYVELDGSPASEQLPQVVLTPRVRPAPGTPYWRGASEVASKANDEGTYERRALPRLVDLHVGVLVQAKYPRDVVMLQEAIQALLDDTPHLAVPDQGNRELHTVEVIGATERLSGGLPEAAGEVRVRGLRLYRSTATVTAPLVEEFHGHVSDEASGQGVEVTVTEEE